MHLHLMDQFFEYTCDKQTDYKLLLKILNHGRLGLEITHNYFLNEKTGWVWALSNWGDMTQVPVRSLWSNVLRKSQHMWCSTITI